MSIHYTAAQMERAKELAFKQGFDAGVLHQRKAAPPPKARELAKQLAAVTAERDALRALVEPSPLVEAVKAVTP